MDTIDFRRDFLERSRIRADEYRDMLVSAFVAEAAEKLEEADVLSGFTPCYYDGTGSRGRRMHLDGYALDDLDDSISVIVAHYSGDEIAESLSQSDASREYAAAANFVREVLSGHLREKLEDSSPAFGFASTLLERARDITRFRFFIVTDGLLSRRVSQISDGDIEGIPVEYHIWDMSRFHQAYESQTGRDRLEVDFEEFAPGGIAFLNTVESSDDISSYLCVIEGMVLARLYERHGSRLLEGNVRAFLSTGGKVNRQIRETILKQPSRFFALNNGISATATAIEMRDGHIVKASDLQIVNGGQTTASLAHAIRKDRADLSRIRVAMKLSVIDPASADRLIPEISRSANSQNRVSDADFFSNHPFHIRLEDISRRIWAPAIGGAQHGTRWFYERARAQYTTELSRVPQSAQARFRRENPREQLVAKTDLARYELSWRQLPHFVSRGAQKNFQKFAGLIDEEWERTSGDAFNDHYFRQAIAHTILFRVTEKLVSRADWYAERTGYRANIVAYTIAKLAYMIDQAGQMALDTDRIWAQQNLSTALQDQLMKVATTAVDVIYSPIQQYSNIGEWTKNELCWTKLCDREIGFVDEFREELIDSGTIREKAKAARSQRKVDNGIQAQTEVYRLGPGYWSALTIWAKEHTSLDFTNRRLLEQATEIPVRVIHDLQAQQLLRLKHRFEREGFSYTPTEDI